MATITFTIPNDQINEVVDAVCEAYDYTDEVHGQDAQGNPIMVPNPETRNAFAKRMIGEVLKKHVMNYRRRLAAASINATPPDIT